MKTKFKIGLIAVSLGLAAPMWAGAATITFTGEVAASTCDVTINGATAGNVLMPTVPASSLDAAGKTAGLTTFTITAENCPVSANDLVIQTMFLGHNVDVASGGLENDWTGTGTAATNVVIQLTQNADGTSPITLSANPTTVPAMTVQAGDTGATYTYGAQYLAVTGAATVGMVQAVAEYELVYN